MLLMNRTIATSPNEPRETFTTERGGFKRESNTALIMEIFTKYGTFLLQVLYFVVATQETMVQDDSKLNTESYFKLQRGRELTGMVGQIQWAPK